MAGWFAAAGLTLVQVEHLEGGELTVTLWRGTKPVLSDAEGLGARARKAA
jgi:ArsR family transcriptional regulator